MTEQERQGPGTGDTTITLRVARPSDLAAVDALLARSYPALVKADYPPSVVVTAFPIMSRANPALLASGTYHVAEGPEGDILGAGGWTRTGPQGGRRPGLAHVRHVATHRDWTRRGIGSALMGQVASQARAAEMRILDCMSTRTAVPFYASLGFQVVGPAEISLRPGITFPAIRMIRRL